MKQNSDQLASAQHPEPTSIIELYYTVAEVAGSFVEHYYGLRNRNLRITRISLRRPYIFQLTRIEMNRTPEDEFPLTVKEAAKFLGVSAQTVYLWVERKQIPHLRVMGRNIRFLKSDLEPFRASFKQEMENG
jgi:excisionase family DNA binding protein